MEPYISFIIPTLNAERLLARCLRSIRAQNYDSSRYEILIADGGSSDATCRIASEHGARILDAHGMLAEAAKKVALKEAKGDYLAMVDADNEIPDPQWLSKAVSALSSHPDALGFESYYLKPPHSPRINRHLTGNLQISDPIARTLAGNLRLISESEDGVQVFELPKDGSYPTGANGFLFHRKLMAMVPTDQPFHEAAFFPWLIQAGCTKLIKRQDCGIYHYFITGWMNYFRKRRRVVINYKLRRQEVPLTWDSQRPKWRMPATILYHGTIIGPLCAGLWHAIREKDPDWLLYPAVSWWTCLSTALGFWDFWRAKDKHSQARLSMRLSTGTEAKEKTVDKKSEVRSQNGNASNEI